MMRVRFAEQFIGAVAFAGDLTMGQPAEHSPNVAVLAARLADAVGLDDAQRALSARLALLRWAGCTANARDFSDLLGDDIRGRAEMLANRNPFVRRHPTETSLSGHIGPLADAHCEAMSEIARRAGIDLGEPRQPENPGALPAAIDDLFENWDGSGYPHGRSGDEIDPLAQIVAVASEFEIFTRQYGLPRALVLVESRGGRIYDPALSSRMVRHATTWMNEIAASDALAAALGFANLPALAPADDVEAMTVLLSDFAALKQPEVVTVSRDASRVAADAALQLGLDAPAQTIVRQAALLHRLGFVAVSNGSLTSGDESARLAPYWTERILSRAPALAAEARLASMAFERLDGTGYHRGLTSAALPVEARVVATAVAATQAHLAGDASHREELGAQVARGWLDGRVVDAVLTVLDGKTAGTDATDGVSVIVLTARERRSSAS